MSNEQLGYSFNIDHSGDEESYPCWEGLSVLLLLSTAALNKDLHKELNNVKQRVWYVDEDDDNKEKEIEIGAFDIALMWLRKNMNATEDMFEGYYPDKYFRNPENDEA